jgi:hypothetical protein
MHRIGTVSLLIAVGLFIGYTGYQLTTLEGLAPILRIAAGAGTIGLLAFVIASMREVWGKKDKYEEVEK